MATTDKLERGPVLSHQLGGITRSGVSRVTPERLSQWTLTDLQPGTSPITKENFVVLGSYNWWESKRPIIVVPGAPSIWDPPVLPISVKPDHGHIFVDQNAFRHPTSPLEPMLQAVLASNPSFGFNKIDIITDRSNLRRLLRFASAQSQQDFEIIIEVVNETVLFTRAENRPRSYIRSGQSGGYGFQFEKAFTKTPEAVKGSTGHHRIANYMMGGLNILLRFEVDGALPHNVSQGSGSGSAPQAQNPTVVLPTPNDPQSTNWAIMWPNGQSFQGPGHPSQGQWQGQEVGGSPAATLGQQSARYTNLVIVKGGQLIHEQQTVELKTRAYSKDHGLQLQQYMAQLWFSNTRHLVFGMHKEGTFSKVKMHSLDDAAVMAWEETHQEQLGKLADLVRKIAETAKSTTERTRLRCVKGILTMETFHGQKFTFERLSEDLRQKWATGTQRK